MDIVIVLIWLAVCFLIAASAKKKGFNYVGYFFLSLLASPIIGYITLRIADKRESQNESKGDSQ